MFTASITFAALLFILFFIADTTAGFFANVGFNGTQAHLRFSELPIRFRDDSKRHIPLSTIIFLFFSCTAASISFFSTKTAAMPVYEPAPIKKNQTQFEKISAQSWQRHYEFQKDFSFNKISTSDEASYKKTTGEESGIMQTGAETAGSDGYLHYITEENGLITGTQPVPKTTAEPLPPYPLTDLINAIENPQRLRQPLSSNWRNILYPILSCILLTAAFTIFSVLVRRKKSVFCL